MRSKGFLGEKISIRLLMLMFEFCFMSVKILVEEIAGIYWYIASFGSQPQSRQVVVSVR